jgi:GNAT superfamily N-acetyltransferase
MEFRIRPAELSDAGAIAAILRELPWFESASKEPPEATGERVARLMAMCQRDSSHTVLAGECEGAVVGYASVHWLPYLILPAPEGYVSELFILASHRGQGLGKMLLDAVEHEARLRGCSRLSLLNGRHRESYAREFYRKIGWTEREAMANFVRVL